MHVVDCFSDLCSSFGSSMWQTGLALANVPMSHPPPPPHPSLPVCMCRLGQAELHSNLISTLTFRSIKQQPSTRPPAECQKGLTTTATSLIFQDEHHVKASIIPLNHMSTPSFKSHYIIWAVDAARAVLAWSAVLSPAKCQNTGAC